MFFFKCFNTEFIESLQLKLEIIVHSDIILFNLLNKKNLKNYWEIIDSFDY